MIERIPGYLKGYVKIRLESPMPERFLSLCVHNQIPVSNLKNNGIYYEMELSVKDFFRINNFRRKTQSRIVLLEKHGLPFFFYRKKKRKAFFLGCLISIFLMYWCSLYIWDIRLEGNHFNSDDTIWETLKTMNVTDGMPKKALDCQQISADLREIFPDIVWVSARIEGTCLVLEIKENEDSYIETSEDNLSLDSWDLTAKRDGKIVNIITRQGMPKVAKGQECKKGEILVSGEIPILNNDSQVQRYEYVKADADIFIETTYSYYHEFSLNYKERKFTGETKTYPYLRVLDHEFSFYRKSSQSAEIYRQNHQVHLTKSFKLPVYYGIISVKPYTEITNTYTREEAVAIEQEKIRFFMENLVAKGVGITGKNISISFYNDTCKAMGTIDVIESCISKTPVQKSTIS